MDRILLVDDHAMVRAGYRRLLEDAACTGEFVEADTAERALDLLRAGSWRLVVLDLDLPGRTGLDLLRRLAVSRPDVPVLIASGLPETQFAVTVLREGARGFVAKGAAPEEFVAAVKSVLAGQRYVSAAAAEGLLQRMTPGETTTAAAHERLTRREFDILLKLARGESTAAIARDICLSPKTVSTYRGRILDKLALRTNGELTHYALTHGLIQ